jgi:copper(I)-binding protein
VNLFPARASAPKSDRKLAIGLGAALVTATLAGCSAGQQSQTATQEPAVNGASGGTTAVALRDVRIRVDQTGDSIKQGQSVDLMFVAANTSGTQGERLLRISSPVGDVTIAPDAPEVPAGKSLIVGKPDGADAEAFQALSTSPKATATVKLKEPVSNGLTYKFTFVFQQAGNIDISVPVTAGESAPRATAPEAPEASEGSGEAH